MNSIIGCNTVGEVVLGWLLVQCHTASTMQYGLYRQGAGSQAVEFKFSPGTKFLDENRNLKDPEIDALPAEAYDWDFWRSLERQFEPAMTCGIEIGHDLYVACLAAGYEPEKHGGRITYWLSNRIGEVIAAFEASK
jgi:hypothetical protein